MNRSKWFCALGILILALSPLSAQFRLSGTDFVGGSAAVDAVKYMEELLSQPGVDTKDPIFGSGLSIDFNARWTSAEFDVWSADRIGRPLLGPSAGGVIQGSLMTYRLGVTSQLGVPWLRAFIGLDYFVASHLENFGQLFDPFYSANDVLSFLLFGWSGPFTGGKATGFGALAFQVLPGLEVSLPFFDTKLRTGFIFKFRDPIHPSGKFLSTFFVNKDSWNGVIGKWTGDYNEAADIPDGISGINSQEFYFSASVLGLNLDSLLTPSGALAVIRASKLFDLAWLQLKPGFGWISDRYSSWGLGVLSSILNGEYIFGENRELRLGHYLDLYWINDTNSLIVNEARVWASYIGFRAAAGIQFLQERGWTPGWELGLESPPGEQTSFGFKVSYNYAQSMLGGLKMYDTPLFTLWLGIGGSK